MTPAAIHQALVEAGYQIDAADLQAGVIGTSTREAVAEFQRAHVDADGHALEVDGVVGPATEWALQHPGAQLGGFAVPGWRCSPMAARGQAVRILQVAVGQVGVCEVPDGSNRGPQVDRYTMPDLGVPWCAAFVSWCWAHADGGSPFGRILSAMGILRWGENHGRTVKQPVPGDVWIIQRGDRHGHCGLVADVLDGVRVATLEGNSSNAVRGLIRDVAWLAGIVRPTGDLT